MSVTIILALLLLHLMNFVNCLNNNYSSIRCPFRLSSSNNKHQILEFPSLPVSVKFIVEDIDCKGKQIVLSDSHNCLPSLFLTHNVSLFYPFHFQSDFPFSSSYNVTFFNCSSVRQHHLKSWDNTNPGAQDMLSCPIYVADPTESIVDLDLLRCTRIFDKVFPIDAIDIRLNNLELNWSETNFDSRCLECELHNKSKNHTSIILETTGE